MKLPEKNRNFSDIFSEKSIFCVKLPIENQNFSRKSKFFLNCLKNWNSWNRIFLNCLKKSKFFRNLPWKIEIFVKLPEKIEICRKFTLRNQLFWWNCLKKSKFFHPDPPPPSFQTRLRSLIRSRLGMEYGCTFQTKRFPLPWAHGNGWTGSNDLR